MLDWIAQHTLIHSGEIFAVAAVGALLIGMAKAGLSGCGLVSVLLFADSFGAKTSTGIVLPLLIAADFMGYYLLRGGGKWRQIIPLVPPAIAGVVIGWWLLDRLDNHLARITIGWIILCLVLLKIVIDWKREQLKDLHRHPVFTGCMGVLAGAVTMLSNAAGPVMTIYLLAKRFEKHEYLGVFTRFFLFMNLVKVPFSVDMDLINPTSLLTNVVLLPAVVLGAMIGWQVVKVMSQKVFEWVAFAFAIVAALRLVMSHAEQHGVLATDEPRQSMLGAPQATITRDQWTLQPLAEFSLDARVLGVKFYEGDFAAGIAPCDLALGWGVLSDTAVLERLDITQSDRYYRWRFWGKGPVPEQEIRTHSANMHIIPADDAILKKLKSLRRGALIRLSGQLVNVTHPKFSKPWASSLVRDDEGEGSCEIVHVKSLSVR